MRAVGTFRGIGHVPVIAGALVVLAGERITGARGRRIVVRCGYEPMHPFLQPLDPLPLTWR